MRGFKVAAFAAGVVGMAALPALAQSGKVAALVEDAAGVSGIEALDYVNEGQTINLGSGGKLVLSYMDSCQRETITGGTVTIGARESTVNGGQVQKARMQCDRRALQLAAQQAGQSGAAAIRFTESSIPGALPQPQLTVRSVSPVLRVPSPGAVAIERLDKPGNLSVQVAGRALDMAKAGNKLEAGGLYRIKFGEKSLVVKVDDRARADGGAVGDRLIPLL